MSLRADLTAVLDGRLPPEWDWYDYPTSIDALDVARPALVLDAWTSAPHPVSALTANTATLALITPLTGSPDADDDLDALWPVLRDLLESVSALVSWTGVERATYRGQYPALQITLTFDTKE